MKSYERSDGTEWYGIEMSDMAETPPNDSIRQTVLDTAQHNPSYGFAEVHELLRAASQDIELKHVVGAMTGL